MAARFAFNAMQCHSIAICLLELLDISINGVESIIMDAISNLDGSRIEDYVSICGNKLSATRGEREGKGR